MKKKKILKSDFFYFIIAILGLVIIVLFSLWQISPEDNRDLEVKDKTKTVLGGANATLIFFDNLVPWKKIEFKDGNNYEEKIEEASGYINENNDEVINDVSSFLSNELNIEEGKKKKIEFDFNNNEIVEFIEKGFFIYRNNRDIFVGFKNRKNRVFTLILHY